MARLAVLFALCVLLPSIANASPFRVTGKVYCDTCRAGFETKASTYLAGATVRLECKDRDTSAITYTSTCNTNSNGEYELAVDQDRGDDVCDMVLVQSNDPLCAIPDSGRDRARVILTRGNGMTSDVRFANNMGFLRYQPLASCPMVLQQYTEAEN